MTPSSLQLLCRIVLASVLGAACVAKLLNFSWFVEVIAAYKFRWPIRLNLPLAVLVVIMEATTALGLLVWPVPPFSWLASGLFGIFGLLTAVNLGRGEYNAQCGCFGPKGPRISWRLLLRNVTLTGIAWFSLAPLNGVVIALLLLFAFTLVPLPAKFHLRNAVKEV